jgi:muramoyltetrapeptide carboxypeptidase
MAVMPSCIHNETIAKITKHAQRAIGDGFHCFFVLLNIFKQMNRKKFVSSLGLLGAAPFLGMATGDLPTPADFILPPNLRAGDTIGITSPAGYITVADTQAAVNKLGEWGFKVKLGNCIGKRDYSLGGTDQERIDDMQMMINDDAIQAILCARGGYGLIRIIDKINFKPLRTKPKWIIGFSDITVLHSHLHRNIGIASIHSKMCNSFPDDWSKAEQTQIDSIVSIQKSLMGEPLRYSTTVSAANRQGRAEGRLIGGNLKTLETLSASSSDIDTAGKILFVEDTNEYMYSVDRMFWNLQRSGKLSALAGLVIGGFKIKPDDSADDAFGRTLEQVVMEKVAQYQYPVCFDFPVGHQKFNVALKCGVRHQLIVSDGGGVLAEIPGTHFNA